MVSTPITPLQVAANSAVAIEKKYGFPAPVIVAQWAIESAWGKNSPQNNCFGIKTYQGCFGRQLLLTKEWLNAAEVQRFLAGDPGRTAAADPLPAPRLDGRREYICQDWFATFPTLTDCFDRRGQLALHPEYIASLNKYKTDHNLPEFVQAFAKVYATSPTYARLILSIISQENVKAAIDIAYRQTSLPPATPSSSSPTK